MRHILLSSLALGLDDLLSKRLPFLQSFAAGAASVKILGAMRDQIAALPAAALGRPLTNELDTADTRHDGIGGAIWHVTEAVLRHPGTTEAMKEAAKKVRDTFIPKLSDLRASYEIEAQTAREHEAALETLKPELSLIAVPGGGTLLDWATQFIAEGKNLTVLLSQRADQKDRKLASLLRGEVTATLNRLRKTLDAEIRHDPSLPKDLDASVFAYFDLLEAHDSEAYSAAQRKAKEAKKASDGEGSASGSTGSTDDAKAKGASGTTAAGAPGTAGGASQSATHPSDAESAS